MSEDNPYVGNECPSPEALSGFVSGSLPAALLTSVANHAERLRGPSLK
jgi:hypothetical protein